MIRTVIERAGKAILNGIRRTRIVQLGGQPSWRRVPRGFFMHVDPGEAMDIGYYLGTYERALSLFAGAEVVLRRVISPADDGEVFYEVLAVHQSSPRALRVMRFAGERPS